MFWVDGESQQTVDILDRSFQYGDGCFTTMLVSDGEIQHFHDHQHRVDECLKALRISALDWDVVSPWLDTALQHIQDNALHDTKSLGGSGKLDNANKPHNQKAGIKLHVSRALVGVATVLRISLSRQSPSVLLITQVIIQRGKTPVLNSVSVIKR